MPLTAIAVLDHCQSAITRMQRAFDPATSLVLMNGGYEKTFRDFLIAQLASRKAMPMAELMTDTDELMDIALFRPRKAAAFELKHAFMRQKISSNGLLALSALDEGIDDIFKLSAVSTVGKPCYPVSDGERFFIHLVTSVLNYGNYRGEQKFLIGAVPPDINQRIEMLANGYRDCSVVTAISSRMIGEFVPDENCGASIRVDAIVVKVKKSPL